MENGPFEDAFPNEHGDIRLQFYIVYKRVRVHHAYSPANKPHHPPGGSRFFLVLQGYNISFQSVCFQEARHTHLINTLRRKAAKELLN